RRDIVGNERRAQVVLDDPAVGHERFGDPDGHLRVVGVPDLVLGVADQGVDRGTLGADCLGRPRLEFPAESVSDVQSDEATHEPIPDNLVGEQHGKHPDLGLSSRYQSIRWTATKLAQPSASIVECGDLLTSGMRLGPGKYFGYKVPPVLGGEIDLDNFE